jgi:hypothetical protein
VTERNDEDGRSYGCTFGCGNPYDYIVIDVKSGTTEFLCLPDFVRLASDLVAVVTEPDNPEFAQAMAYTNANPTEQAPGPGGRKRGRNAPATNDDPDVFAAFDATVDYEPDTPGVH